MLVDKMLDNDVDVRRITPCVYPCEVETMRNVSKQSGVGAHTLKSKSTTRRVFMRMTAIVAAVASCALIMALHTVKADALSPVTLALGESPTLLDEITLAQAQQREEFTEPLEPEKPPVVTHKVSAGESLIKIANQYGIDWKRIYYKNANLSQPDLLEIDQELVIPDNEEELEERVIVAPEPVLQSATSTSTQSTSASQSQSATASSTLPVSGNLYSRGYCTWYVKNRRPDLPNNLGNADTWYARAASQGFGVGSTPRVGAVAAATTGYMHVAYVEAVHANGTITVSEMNFKGFGVISSRTVSASNFRYIY